MNAVWRFCMNNRNNHPIQCSQGNEPLLFVVESIVNVRKCHT